MIESGLAPTNAEQVPPWEISQAELRLRLAQPERPIVAGFWRPHCILSALTWPRLRELRAHFPDVLVVRVNLSERELPDPELEIRWLPATVLFSEGRVRRRWYSAAVPWSQVARLVEDVRTDRRPSSLVQPETPDTERHNEHR